MNEGSRPRVWGTNWGAAAFAQVEGEGTRTEVQAEEVETGSSHLRVVKATLGRAIGHWTIGDKLRRQNNQATPSLKAMTLTSISFQF